MSGCCLCNAKAIDFLPAPTFEAERPGREVSGRGQAARQSRADRDASSRSIRRQLYKLVSRSGTFPQINADTGK